MGCKDEKEIPKTKWQRTVEQMCGPGGVALSSDFCLLLTQASLRTLEEVVAKAQQTCHEHIRAWSPETAPQSLPNASPDHLGTAVGVAMTKTSKEQSHEQRGSLLICFSLLLIFFWGGVSTSHHLVVGCRHLPLVALDIELLAKG